jgi:hypothetical protein
MAINLNTTAAADTRRARRHAILGLVVLAGCMAGTVAAILVGLPTVAISGLIASCAWTAGCTISVSAYLRQREDAS